MTNKRDDIQTADPLFGPVDDDSRRVTINNGPRPNGEPDQCFYCGKKLGSYHSEKCVLVQKKARIRVVVEYDIDVPADWDASMVRFHRNEGSWCASNVIDELEDRFGDEGGRCMCHATTIEVIDWRDE